MSYLTERAVPLRHALLLDAGASGGMGLLLLVAARPLAPLLGLPADLLFGAGVILVPFAALLAWVAARGARAPGVILAIVAGNVLWAVGSVVLLLLDGVAPTLLGEGFVLLQAAAVAGFAALEYRGWQRAAVSVAA